MRKIVRLLCVLAVAAVLCSCGAVYDVSDLSQFIDPASYGSPLPAQPPSSSLPEEGNAKYQENVQQQQKEVEPDYDENLEWELTGGRFVSDEFSFKVSSQWIDHFVLTGDDKGSSSMLWRTFAFYYYEEETDISIEILQIEVVSSSFIDSKGVLSGSEELGRSSNGKYCYLRMINIKISPPERFQSNEALYVICLSFNSPETFDFQVTC